jgi:hypothetical protein
MDNIINEYQKWKKQGEQLRAQAKHAMESRYAELLSEAVQIAQEYHRDFGAALKPPSNVTAFRFKTAAGKKGKKAGGKAATAAVPAVVPEKPASVDPKVAGLQKQRAQVLKKIAAAQAAGKPTKNLDDKLYEVEDELRLAGVNV